MRSHLRELFREAKKLGFRFDGYDGSGHPRLVHNTGRRLSVSHTPSDVKAKQNALADMRRINREEGDAMSTTTVTQEAWKTLIGLPAFELSNAGRFRKRLTGKIIRPFGHGAGLTVRLMDDKGRVHEKNVRKTVQSHFGCNPVQVVEDNLSQTIGERMKVRELANPISHQSGTFDPQPTPVLPEPQLKEKGEDMTIQASELGLPVEHVGLPRHTVEVPEPDVLNDTVRWAKITHEGVAEGYEINTAAEILSPHGAVLKYMEVSNHLWVSLRRAGSTSRPYLQLRVDLLMCETFMGTSPGKDWGPKHVNGDFTDCSVGNLVWAEGYAIAVGSHLGKHRVNGRLLTEEQTEQHKAEVRERKRERDRERYRRKASKKAKVAEPKGERRFNRPEPPEEDLRVPLVVESFHGSQPDEVQVSTVTSYRFRGIEVIVDQDGNFQAPEMTLMNASDLARILAKVGEHV